MTLTEFLLARIAEDEAVARWGRLVDDPSDPDSGMTILRWDHARLIAECESKRRIIDECTGGLKYDVSCGEGHWGNFENILRILAAPYADHPDYLPKWKP
jgi:hypothetical protein